MAGTGHEAKRSLLDRALGLFAEVRGGEAVTAILLTFNVFVLLTSYYVIKPVREGLLGEITGGAEYKSYLAGGIAILLLVAVPAYASFASRVKRNRLIVSVTLFFASHLVVFYFLALLPPARAVLGFYFYVWIGIFNMMVVAQFWAFANDLYTEEQGKRLFAIVGIGASVGAATGSGFGIWLSTALGLEQMMLVSAGLLAVSAVLTQLAHLRETRNAGAEAGPSPKVAPSKKIPKGAFQMVFSVRYLTYLAVFSVLFTCVNSNGEYMMSSLVNEAANALVESGELADADRGNWIGHTWSEFFFAVNVAGVVIQSFVVSRLVKYGGLKIAFFVLPVVALLDASAVAILPVLAVLRIGKVAENSVDYSVNNTVRNMMWLPTTTEMKYKAKQAVDTFFVRMGDVSNALVVFVLAGLLGFGVRAVAITNIVLVVLWLFLAAAILREQRKLKHELGIDEDDAKTRTGTAPEPEPEAKPKIF